MRRATLASCDCALCRTTDGDSGSTGGGGGGGGSSARGVLPRGPSRPSRLAERAPDRERSRGGAHVSAPRLRPRGAGRGASAARS